MNTHKRWKVDILINELDHKIQAHARLDTHDDHHAHGLGIAPRRPVNPGDSETLDHLAAALALRELADNVASRVGRDLEADTRERDDRHRADVRASRSPR